jgi:predicted lipoprotein with Yx(FWY)xxD motif
MRAFLVLVALAAMLAAPTSASARTQSSVTVDASKYGRILFDGRGFALYTFTRDARGRSTCSTTPPLASTLDEFRKLCSFRGG